MMQTIFKLAALLSLLCGYFYGSAFLLSHVLGVEGLINWSVFPVIPGFVFAVLVLAGIFDRKINLTNGNSAVE